MACASCSVIEGCALVGVAKAAKKPRLIRIGKIVRFMARSRVSLTVDQFRSRYQLELLAFRRTGARAANQCPLRVIHVIPAIPACPVLIHALKSPSTSGAREIIRSGRPR